MNRRHFLIGSLVTGTLVSSGSYYLTRPQVNKAELTILSAIERLDKIMSDEANANGDWNLAQVFNHCAQSVEYSMVGFPEHKPEWFKETLGQLAFDLFSSRGEMLHNLSEPIPGAPQININSDVDMAYARLRAAMMAFDQFDGGLAEHFSFGKLNKMDYEQAHVMHFYNHLLEVETENNTA